MARRINLSGEIETSNRGAGQGKGKRRSNNSNSDNIILFFLYELIIHNLKTKYKTTGN